MEDRAIAGHWEGALLSGAKNSYMAARWNVIRVLPCRYGMVVAALSRRGGKLPTILRCSLTWDGVLEGTKHKTFTVATNVKV